ncbi:MAG: ABC transporter permease [Puniceicoccales bacterium]|jgi:putative ABC transport system permease protein|nr:ABC transporter permease [Puniceicoccales bacterium]
MNGYEWNIILQIGLIYGIVAIGIFLSFRVLNFADMTCDGAFTLGGCLAAVGIKLGLSVPMALIFAFLGGGVAGWATACLHNYCKITDILAGILVAFMLYSLNLRIMGGVPNVTLHVDGGCGKILTSVGTGVILVIGYLLISDFGLALRGLGQNRHLSQSYGIRTAKTIATGLALSNGLIALGGSFFALTQNFCDIGSGIGTLVIGLASMVIGEKILPFRSPAVAVAACVVGSIVYRLIIGFALHCDVLSLRSSDLNLITGLLIIAFMTTRGRQKRCFP